MPDVDCYLRSLGGWENQIRRDSIGPKSRIRVLKVSGASRVLSKENDFFQGKRWEKIIGQVLISVLRLDPAATWLFDQLNG